MTDRAPTVLTLELDEVVEPIAGRVRTAAGRALPFRGWTGLAAALERATSSPPPPPPEESPDA
ncbi:hypothetical protein AB0L40_25260 [Patulibacter sp. NPDC049589]|uniref:hypothetical protein n=1 Tax=Patulibacter sp. NPDC049589 TaxID=3154731 RepID=UPI00343EB951